MDKENRYKKLIIIGAILLVLLVVYLGVKLDSKKNALALILDFGDGSKKTFYNYTPQEKSAWSFLQQATAISSVELEPDVNFYPKKIDGYMNGDKDKKWTFYVNGTKQEASPINVMVNIPDRLVFKFE